MQKGGSRLNSVTVGSKRAAAFTVEMPNVETTNNHLNKFRMKPPQTTFLQADQTRTDDRVFSATLSQLNWFTARVRPSRPSARERFVSLRI